jgi:radical SAM superfamily enzyme YgiQ (UPF0313 family)
LTDADLDWADLVMIGGMLNQQPDFIYLIDLAHLHGKPVCVGGPDVSSSPHLYADADFQVIGEAEHIMADFIAAWESGERKGVLTAEKFKIDVTLSPMPRYDLIKFDHYFFIGGRPTESGQFVGHGSSLRAQHSIPHRPPVFLWLAIGGLQLGQKARIRRVA